MLLKSMIMGIWVVGTSNHSLYDVFKLKKNSRKNKVVTGKTTIFVIGPFCIPILFVLRLASEKETC